MMVADVLVAVVDNDLGVCRSVSRALAAHGFRVQTFDNAQAYLDARHQLEPTCVLADIRMPGLDGVSMHRAARADGSEVPTVFMTGTGDVTTVVDAMKSGASDLLAKPFTTDALLAAIQTAVGRAQRADVEHHSLADLWRSLERLTPREAEIAALVASGRLNKQVAALTGITEKTVKVHRARAMRKLEAASLAELVRIIDRIMSETERRTLHVDGVEVARPAAVDVIARVLGDSRAPATKDQSTKDQSTKEQWR
jgi:FixJ family two-component response regulator